MNEWQPIETAPKDGTVIRGRNLHCSFDCRFVSGEWQLVPLRWNLGPAKFIDDPIHWMPLPKPLK